MSRVHSLEPRPSATSSPRCRQDDSSDLPEPRGPHSRVSRSPSSRTAEPLGREKRTGDFLPGPVSRGGSTRNVVYYQNRFLVIDTTPARLSASPASIADPVTSRVSQAPVGGASPRDVGSVLHSASAARGADDKSKAQAAAGSAGTGHMALHCSTHDTLASAGIAADDTFPRAKRATKNLEMDASSVSMDGRGIEIMICDESGVSHRANPSPPALGKRALLKKIGTVLLDNRMAGKDNSEQLLTERPEEYRVLKKVLNIMFVTVGVALLFSVFVVIGYTAIFGDSKNRQDSGSASHGLQSSQQISTEFPRNLTTE